MDTDVLLERLTRHRALGEAPAFEQRWIVEHGEFVEIPRGGFYIRRGERADFLWIILTGHLAIYVDRGLGPRRVLEWRAGDVGGHMPYSRLVNSPGDVIALEPSELLVVNRGYFPDLVRECPTVTTTLVHVMLDRARAFTSSDLQDEKMVSLGRLAAGLAHELNNPASAVKRSAQLLGSLMDQAEDSTRILAEAHLSEVQLEAIDRARRICQTSLGTMTPLERADREEALDAWLSDHDADPGLATALLDTGATPASLDDLFACLQGEQFETAARWIASCCSVRTLAGEIGTASSRMHELVSAIKRFSYMDQTQVPEPTDIAQGLRDSVALLQHKARDKSIALTVAIDERLPRALAIGSDLNQVWTNLIDNALDAAPASGVVSVSASAEQGGVLVRVVDNGPGIPRDLRERIFDAFFTTKGVGKGTGLGLEVTRRLVLRNSGDIEVDSEPGHTEFRVLLRIGPDPAPRQTASPISA
jgi:signal transduction histidine kinase